MRADTSPAGDAVASVIASGWRTPAATASSNQRSELDDRVGVDGLGGERHERQRCQTGGMAFHHVAIATRDLEATHRFYSEAMGFELVNVDVIPFMETGWARHLFYDTGNGEMLAIWDLHDDALARLSTPRSRPGSACRTS